MNLAETVAVGNEVEGRFPARSPWGTSRLRALRREEYVIVSVETPVPNFPPTPDGERPSSFLRLGPSGELFLVSVLILFLELACIRWFPAHVLFLTFFTNVVLLAAFLGMSLGC